MHNSTSGCEFGSNLNSFSALPRYDFNINRTVAVQEICGGLLHTLTIDINTVTPKKRRTTHTDLESHSCRYWGATQARRNCDRGGLAFGGYGEGKLPVGEFRHRLWRHIIYAGDGHEELRGRVIRRRDNCGRSLAFLIFAGRGNDSDDILHRGWRAWRGARGRRSCCGGDRRRRRTRGGGGHRITGPGR